MSLEDRISYWVTECARGVYLRVDMALSISPRRPALSCSEVVARHNLADAADSVDAYRRSIGDYDSGAFRVALRVSGEPDWLYQAEQAVRALESDSRDTVANVGPGPWRE